MGPFITAVTPDDGPRVDLSKPTYRDLSAVTAPVVGEFVTYTYPLELCGASITEPLTERHGTYSCNRPAGHDRSTHPCTGVSFERWGEAGEPDIYRVMSVAPLYVPPTYAEYAETQRLLADAIAERRRVTVERDALTAKIEDIREYVIQEKNDGSICAPGTLRFLRHFDMAAWDQDYTVHYGDFSFDVEALSFAQAAGRAERAMRNAVGSMSGFPYSTNGDYTPDRIENEEGDSDTYPYEGTDNGE